MAGLHFAIARAPGWRIARFFGAMALTAGLYSALNTVYCLDGVPDVFYLTAGRFSYLAATVQGVLWVLYAYSNKDGSLRTAPRMVSWVAVSSLATGILFAASGWLMKAEVSLVQVPWASATYHYPVTTTTGDIYGLAILALPAWAIFHLARRVRRGERSLRGQTVLFAVVFLFALEEVLVANRVLNFPSLLDIGLLFVVLPFTWQVVTRIINDAQRLRYLSDDLESEVLRRTEELAESRNALFEAEKEVRDLVGSLDAIVWQANASTLQATYVSDGAERLLGYPTDQWRSQKGFWHDYVHPDDRQRVLVSMKSAVQSGRTVSLEYRMMAADGRIHWVRDYVYPGGNLTARSNRLRGVTVDVTESRYAHEALLESEQRFRTLFENATVGLYRTTADGRILMANPALVNLLKYDSFEELSRRNLEEDGFEPDYPRASFQKLLAERGIVTGIEAKWTRRDGSIVYVRESARAVRADDGSVLYYDGIVEDFTQRKRAEDALRESEERFRNIADTCPVIIWYSDADRQTTFLSKQAAIFTGLEIDKLLGSGWVRFVHPDDLARVNSARASAVSGHSSYQIEFRILRYDGEYRWTLDTAIPRFVGGVFAGHTGIVVDITDLKRSQERALASQKLESLGVLASGIAHDFNNMLGSILSLSELALTEIRDGSPAAEGLEDIKNVAMQAAEIVRQLLAYAGEDDTAFESVDLSRLVDEMLQLLKVTISKKSTLRAELDEHLPPVQANPAQIRRVVMNLITNASEAIGEHGGVIAVRTGLVRRERGLPGENQMETADRDYVQLQVGDTGCGMSEDVRARIFDPFFTTKFAGRGLGLAAVQGIIRAHGGMVRVVSASGEGTLFEIMLPCNTDRASGDDEAVLRNSVVQDDSVCGNILFVEDEAALRTPASKMLRMKGFSVVEAADGRAAVEFFRANHTEINVVLLDLTLPGMGGSDVLAEVRRIRPDIRVILTTAYSKETAVDTVDGLGDWAFIRKPYAIADLARLIRDVVTG
jgi:PAS domain S-box-containing protein